MKALLPSPGLIAVVIKWHKIRCPGLPMAVAASAVNRKKMLDHNLTSPGQQPKERVETGSEMVAFLHDSACRHIYSYPYWGCCCRWDNFSPPTSPSLSEVIVNEELSLSHSTFERSSSVCGWLWMDFSMAFLGFFFVIQVAFLECDFIWFMFVCLFFFNFYFQVFKI